MAEFAELIPDIARTASVTDVQDAIRSAHGRGAAAWLADQEGLSRRTARRWLSASPPRSRIPRLLALVPTASIAAQVIRRAGAVTARTVSVSYDDRPQGTRALRDTHVDDRMRVRLETAAHWLDRGNIEAAADAMSEALIARYEEGLQDTLTIDHYDDLRID